VDSNGRVGGYLPTGERTSRRAIWRLFVASCEQAVAIAEERRTFELRERKRDEYLKSVAPAAAPEPSEPHRCAEFATGRTLESDARILVRDDIQEVLDGCDPIPGQSKEQAFELAYASRRKCAVTGSVFRPDRSVYRRAKPVCAGRSVKYGIRLRPGEIAVIVRDLHAPVRRLEGSRNWAKA